MISFTTINCDGEYRPWTFDCIEEILKEYWADDKMIDLPSNDDEVFNGNFVIDNEVIEVSTFENIITELSIIYWSKLNV